MLTSLAERLWIPRKARHLAEFASLLETWRQRARQRRDLARLNEHRLRDIGISLAQAQQEAGKPFWRE